MTNVSKKSLKKDVRKEINRRFIATVVSLNTLSGGKSFLSEFLSEAEQLMLAKRFMVIFMLSEEISQYRIKQMLHVSPATVLKIANDYDRNAFTHIVKLCRKRQNRKILLQQLEVIARLGMPSMGKDRWKWLDEIYN